MGAARAFDLSIIICILGNFAGSLIMWYFSKDFELEKPKNKKKLKRKK